MNSLGRAVGPGHVIGRVVLSHGFSRRTGGGKLNINFPASPLFFCFPHPRAKGISKVPFLTAAAAATITSSGYWGFGRGRSKTCYTPRRIPRGARTARLLRVAVLAQSVVFDPKTQSFCHPCRFLLSVLVPREFRQM